jgi:hypothetical protein
VIQVPQQLQVVTGEVAGTTSSVSSVIGSSSGTLFSVVEGGRSFSFAPVLAPLEQQIIVDPMLTSELRYGDLWSMREFNHFDFELNGIIRAFYALRLMISWIASTIFGVHYPLRNIRICQTVLRRRLQISGRICFLLRLSTMLLGCLWLPGLLYPVYGILLSPVIAAAAMALSSVSVIAKCVASKSVRLGEITLNEGSVTNRRSPV